MDIVYLDQNKWIELARVRAGELTTGPVLELYPQLLHAVKARKVLFPLSVSHVLETSKRNDPVSRGHLAEAQAALSRGHAYRSRTGRLNIEVRRTLHRLLGGQPPALPSDWFIASSFLEAFEPMDSTVAAAADVASLARINAVVDPATQYVDYMKNQDDARRRAAHLKLTAGLTQLVARMEERRKHLVGETVDLRRRAYAVNLFMDHQELFLRILNDLGYSFDQLKALGDQAIRSLVEEVTTLTSKRGWRLAWRQVLVTLNRTTCSTFSPSIRRSHTLVASSRRRPRSLAAGQAKLDVKYGVKLSQSLCDLLGVYAEQ